MKHEHLWSHVNIPHALLLIGQRAQTLDFARTFAYGFLCAAPKKGHACGACQSCQLLAANNHPDFRLLCGEGKSNT
ncbi:MAG: hypothetical protein ABSF18_06590, partial [Gammaproteobacteria bacterium]